MPTETATETGYINLSEAATMLGVTRQRVHSMVKDGSLAHIRPWPRTVLVKTTDVQAWHGGERNEPVTKSAARKYILERTEAGSINEVSLPLIDSLLHEFVAERRTDMDTINHNKWVQGMTAILLGSGR